MSRKKIQFYKSILGVFLVYVVLEIQTEVLHVRSQCATTEQHPQILL